MPKCSCSNLCCPPGGAGPAGPPGPVLSPGVNVPNINALLSGLPLTKILTGLTGNVSGISISSGFGSFVEGGGNVASGPYSHAEGLGTQATSVASHSEGISTISANLGTHSEGIATRAVGVASHAEGGGSLALGDYSHAEGDPCTAYGYASHAEGLGCTAAGTGSHAEGVNTCAAVLASHSEGNSSQALGFVSHAEGAFTLAGGPVCHAEGSRTTATGDTSHAEGLQTVADGIYCHAEGFLSTAVGFVTHAEGFVSGASGFYCHAEGSSHASGFVCHSEGNNTSATGFFSHAEGIASSAEGFAVHAQNISTVAGGLGSHAQGFFTLATGAFSSALGNNTITDLDGTVVSGINGWVTPGTTGITGAPNNGGTYSFQLAGGSSVPLAPGDGISVILRTAIPGTPQPVGEIITDYFTSASADYAEYFEWADGNPDKERRLGYFVQLDQEKITLATGQRRVIGVTSRTSNIIGDAAELAWYGTRETDEFGVPVTEENYLLPLQGIAAKNQLSFSGNSKEEVINNLYAQFDQLSAQLTAKLGDREVSQLTPLEYYQLFGATSGITSVEQYISGRKEALLSDLTSLVPVQTVKRSSKYNAAHSYVPRSQRAEWVPVGLLGKLYVRDDGTCLPGQDCDCLNGIAVPGSSWPVLSRVAPTVVRILFQ